MAFGKSIKIYQASIVILTILAFFIGITVESWHTHEHSSEQVSSHTTSHNDEKNPAHSDKDDCPLCNVHITKDIVITDFNTVQADIVKKEHNTFSPHIPYIQPQSLYSARAPPFV